MTMVPCFLDEVIEKSMNYSPMSFGDRKKYLTTFQLDTRMQREGEQKGSVRNFIRVLVFVYVNSIEWAFNVYL